MTTSTPKTTVVTFANKQETPTRWADANTVTYSGRVYNAELVEGRYGEFVALDVITRPVQDDDASQVVVHLTSSNLVSFMKAGGIPTGRSVTVTGNMTGIETSYTNKDGELMLLARPRVRLGDFFLTWGAKPSKK